MAWFHSLFPRSLTGDSVVIRIVAPFAILISLFFIYYYGRQYVNRLAREGKVGYQDKKSSSNKRSSDRVAEEEEADREYERILNPDHSNDGPVVGKTDRYEWTQTNDEIEVYIPLSKYGDSISSREINVSIQPKKFKVVLKRETIFEEEFTASVKVDDSCWMLDNNTAGDPHIWLTLTKASPTIRNQHWKSLFKGDTEVDLSKLGPPVHAVDPNDKDSIRQALKPLKKDG